jgi:NADH:ubiquinone oxidoreductase subunit K
MQHLVVSAHIAEAIQYRSLDRDGWLGKFELTTTIYYLSFRRMRNLFISSGLLLCYCDLFFIGTLQLVSKELLPLFVISLVLAIAIQEDATTIGLLITFYFQNNRLYYLQSRDFRLIHFDRDGWLGKSKLWLWPTDSDGLNRLTLNILIEIVF